ncbi:chemotaxis protein methyltransferase CheR [Carboxydocella sporoproducens DSM 16521]|uniref:Chemotaxis protein methyltransferase CheR n=2 Tax=Carboxydocella TaxID=178898 RepID=A0A1T4S928_9FIRM|nr:MULTISPECIES: CheR family methyltransferase [Carboxydocella]AVX20120.1 chemotaxis protein methyltransferase CheR [Carboxydocella thermautotrophica]AVX30539.1 chemotaxis protein methyltransferase CheR [Carboxydocella thermautotrophica]SKA24702.1 chemotaxis protein methyltransferase CheR [Carboxydocella sporoproducens DSM 16521]
MKSLLRDTIYQLTGNVLSNSKIDRIENQLVKIYNLKTTELNEFITSNLKTSEFRKILIDLATINETYFFREEHLLDTMIYLLKKSPFYKDIFIWSAAASTGEEAYSIAIKILESGLILPNTNWQIVGTDINPLNIEKARQGCYNKNSFTFRQVKNEKLIKKYFSRHPDNHDILIVKDSIKNHVIFHVANLINLSDLETKIGNIKFNIVFLKNVLFYFDSDNKKIVLDNIYNFMERNSYLILGSSESIYNIKHNFIRYEINNSIVYKKI